MCHLIWFAIKYEMSGATDQFHDQVKLLQMTLAAVSATQNAMTLHEIFQWRFYVFSGE